MYAHGESSCRTTGYIYFQFATEKCILSTILHAEVVHVKSCSQQCASVATKTMVLLYVADAKYEILSQLKNAVDRCLSGAKIVRAHSDQSECFFHVYMVALLLLKRTLSRNSSCA